MQTAKRPRELGLIVAFLVIVLFVTVYTFVLQLNYSNMAVDTAVAWDTRCADAIHRLVSNTFTRDDFENITTRSDMSTERYYELQSKLNELRSLNSTRYLYTAKRGADGRLIYLIDGLDLDADDFAYPGTHIEEEMVPYIDAALLGKTIYSPGNRGHHMGTYFHGLLSGEGRLGRNHRRAVHGNGHGADLHHSRGQQRPYPCHGDHGGNRTAPARYRGVLRDAQAESPRL